MSDSTAPFTRALAFTWRPENDGQPLHTTPGDAGGATAWGVTQRTWAAWGRLHPTLPFSVGDATQAQLADLIHAWFWLPAGAGLPPGVDLMVFDFGFGSGPGTAARQLQACVGAVPDGRIGPYTLAAVTALDPAALCERLHATQVGFYQGCAGFAEFGRGWIRRADDRLAATVVR